MAKTIGIDLGTTNSCVAVMEGGEPKVIENKEGNRTTPSVVAFTNDGRLVGQLAKRQAVSNPQNTIYSIKRFMGRRHNEVAQEEKMVPYTIVGKADELVKVEAHGKEYTPPEISAMILQYLKQCAEDYLGEKVTDAVITVPAYFNDAQRQATKDAGRIAGLNVKRIVNEPTAASLAYGLGKKKDQKVAVFDLGGGTFDISILEVADVDGNQSFEVLATNGDTHLGGDDFDEAIIRWIAEEFRKDQGIDLKNDKMALQRLKEAAEKAKCELSSAPSTDINIPYITADAGGPKHLQMNLKRAKLEELLDPIVEKVRQPCLQCLKDANLSPKDVDEVILVGGSTRMPAVGAICKEIFQREPHRGVNPDEVVAVGAAIQAGVLGGEVRDVLLLDVTPLTLGIETAGGVMTPLIERNTTIPVSKKEVFSTAADNQPAVDIHVLQGERKMASGNRTLGKFMLDGIPPAPRGVPQIEITFNLDHNGILSVQAKDKATGKEQSITIKSASGLSEEEIKKMMAEAEAHAKEDEERVKLVNAQNQADQLVFHARKSVKEAEEKGPVNFDLSAINAACDELEKVRKDEDLGAIEAGIKKLEEAAHAFAQHRYQQMAAEQQAATGAASDAGAGADAASGAAGEAKKDDGIVDADFTVVDDDKKKGE